MKLHEQWGPVRASSDVYFSIHKESCNQGQVWQLFLTLCNPKDYTVPGILHARILEWVAFAQLDLPNPGIKPRPPTLQVDSLPSEPFYT